MSEKASESLLLSYSAQAFTAHFQDWLSAHIRVSFCVKSLARGSSIVLATKPRLLLVGIGAVFLECWGFSPSLVSFPSTMSNQGWCYWLGTQFGSEKLNITQMSWNSWFSITHHCESHLSVGNGMVLFVKRTKVVVGFLKHTTQPRRWYMRNGEEWALAFDSPLPAQDPLCAGLCKPRGFPLPQVHYCPLSFRWVCWAINAWTLFTWPSFGESGWWGPWGISHHPSLICWGADLFRMR